MEKKKKYQRNAEWRNNMKKEFEELEEVIEAYIHLDSLKASRKKILNWNT